jgi:hypothetical protein
VREGTRKETFGARARRFYQYEKKNAMVLFLFIESNDKRKLGLFTSDQSGLLLYKTHTKTDVERF